MKQNLLKRSRGSKNSCLTLAIVLCCVLFSFSCKKTDSTGLPTDQGSSPKPEKTADQKKYTNVYNGVNYSSDHPYNVNIIYFLPTDVPLDSTYKKRLSAVLLWGQNFYKENMVSNGYGPKTFGLLTETANPQNVQILLVRGQHPLSSYPSGNSIEGVEVNAFKTENPTLITSSHTLIITAIPTSKSPGVPFYGTGRTCYALDYPQFDLKYLGPSTGPLSDDFISWFGGMMHELGHALNLPHSHQTNTENNNPKLGTNLMADGNYTLGRKPTFINRAGSSILNNCQAFADAPGNTYYNGHNSGLTSIHAVYSSGNLTVSGTYASDMEVTDINVYQDPHATPSEGYDRVAWSVKPGAGNSFTVTMPVSELKNINGPYTLEVALVLKNGENAQSNYGYTYSNGVPTINIDFDENKSCDILLDWTLANIGTNINPGNICYTAATNDFKIKSFASGLGDPTDNFPFLYQTLTGNGQIVARVKSVSTNYNYLGGIMIRNTLSSNSAYVCLSSLDTRGVFAKYRTSDAGNSSYRPVTSLVSPMWLKLVRVGNLVTSYYSSDKITWTKYYDYQFTSLNSTIYLGLAASGSFCATDIDDVTISKM